MRYQLQIDFSEGPFGEEDGLLFVHNEKMVHHLILLVLHQKYAEWIHQEMPPVWIDFDTVHCKFIMPISLSNHLVLI
ncbi:hypothetical protein CN341_15015 [Bacillus cereus]|nr:hypothetical protein IE1_05365 [Bacillus cereus BAG3O-2]EJQ19260.1 hypothetical protein IE7_05375 [Bacillus cereus BAG4O-1]MBG9702514.1 hypothetical protein [Bacillus thuringiensis]PEW36889.1 hypothetical protein CN436_28110 [Bacillus cereus]PFF77371.1 hypothetical protein CN341_15015 [Bacillus cereus]